MATGHREFCLQSEFCYTSIMDRHFGICYNIKLYAVGWRIILLYKPNYLDSLIAACAAISKRGNYSTPYFSFSRFKNAEASSLSSCVFPHQPSQNSKSDIISNTFGVYTLVILKFSINSIGT